MKKIDFIKWVQKSKFLSYLFLSIGLICFTASSHQTLAQISSGGTPPSFKQGITLQRSNQIPVLEMPSFNKARLLQEDIDNENSGLPYRFAKSFQVNYDFRKEAICETLSNGDQVCRLSIKSTDAYALNVFFDNFLLPEGAQLFAYNKDQTHIIGAFTHKNNKDNGGLSLQFISGEEIMLEYFEPAKTTFRGKLNIGQIGHDYKNILGGLYETGDPSDGQYGLSNSCNVDINCSQGANWQDEKHAVCRMFFYQNGGWYLCTGAVVNNTAEDGTPYFLTANHCVSSSSVASTIIFYFNYESPSCNGGDGSVNQTVSGSTLKATWQNADMTLVEMSSTPPASYDTYYAGWNRADYAASNSVGIHHPRGDVKKISIDYNASYSYPSPISWNGWITTPAYHHWRVYFDVGMTEGGSSGSPLFDQNHHIVGQLTGGSGSSCSNDVSYYGKMAKSWLGGGSSNSRLSNWLDPNNTGLTELDGSYLNGSNCPTDLTITQTYSNGNVADVEVSNSITSTSTINSGANITFDAGNEVNLLAGFDAKIGCDFLAVIDGCGGSYKTTNDAPRIVLQEQTELDMVAIKCYPNPFSESTTISYTLSSDQTVSLSIFSATGQEVGQLLDNIQQTAGTHEISFNGNDLPTGIYFYRFSDGNGAVHTGKISRH